MATFNGVAKKGLSEVCTQDSASQTKGIPGRQNIPKEKQLGKTETKAGGCSLLSEGNKIWEKRKGIIK